MEINKNEQSMGINHPVDIAETLTLCFMESGWLQQSVRVVL